MNGESGKTPSTNVWSTDYALTLTLTKDQWTSELWNPLFDASRGKLIRCRFEPVRSVVEQLSLEIDVKDAFHPNWKIYGVSISTEPD
jgi:hypothetical protein